MNDFIIKANSWSNNISYLLSQSYLGIINYLNTLNNIIKERKKSDIKLGKKYI